MYVHQVLPNLEGLLGFVQTKGDLEGSQSIGTFIEVCKLVMNQPQIRNDDGWIFFHQNDIDATGDLIYTGAAFVHALLYRTTSAAVDHLCLTDNTSNTYAGQLVLDADDMLCFEMQIQAQGTWRIGSLVSVDGIYCGTGIVLAAEDLGGTDAGADDNDCFILYRTD